MLLVICYPDEQPKFVEHDKLEMPDGCDGWFCAVLPSGIASLLVTPINKARPMSEQVSEYLAGLSCAGTFLRYKCVANLDQIEYPERDPVMATFIHHIDTVMMLVKEQILAEHLMPPEVISAIISAGFGVAHDKCCPDPVCRADMHKVIHGSRGEN